MTIEQLNNIKVYSRIKINKGTYKDKIGSFIEVNNKFIVLKVKDDTILFPINEYINFIEILS